MLQLHGLAEALDDEEVALALLSIPTLPVAISVFEWSGRASQRVIADWTFLRNEADLAQLTARLRSTQRHSMGVSTGLGTAMLLADARFATAPPCLRQVLDISGDGKSNDGPRPQDVRPPALNGVIVNALVIGSHSPGAVGAQARETEDLVNYFRAYVIRGPGSFIEIAVGFDDYAQAMKRKLLRELDVIVLGAATPGVPARQ